MTDNSSHDEKRIALRIRLATAMGWTDVKWSDDGHPLGIHPLTAKLHLDYYQVEEIPDPTADPVALDNLIEFMTEKQWNYSMGGLHFISLSAGSTYAHHAVFFKGRSGKEYEATEDERKLAICLAADAAYNALGGPHD